jgi:phosphoenolpyruvate synthase/pyruvate phosphate dikinase
MKEKVKEINWKVFLERKNNTIFYLSIYIISEGILLNKKFGRCFETQLYTSLKDTITYYRSEHDLNEVYQYFFKLNNRELDELYDSCMQWFKNEEELIDQFNKITSAEILKNYYNIIEESTNIFMYLSTIPFLILNSKSKEKNIDRFMEFRKKSRTILQEKVYNKIWITASELYGFEPDYYSFFTINEIKELFNSGNRPTEEEIKKRKEFCIIITDFNSQEVIYDKEVLSQIKIPIKEIPNTNKLYGKCAYLGYAKGKVVVLNKISDLAKFVKGDIIVSKNTAPYLNPALKECSGIVADDGGISSHTAVIAREFQKPCVIGTKFATDIFKDGDIVEVDANKGVVRKIE